MKKITDLNKYITHRTPKYQPITKKEAIGIEGQITYSYMVKEEKLKESIEELQSTILKLQGLDIVKQIFFVNKYQDIKKQRKPFNGYDTAGLSTDPTSYSSYVRAMYMWKLGNYAAVQEPEKKYEIHINLTYIKKIKKLVIIVKGEEYKNTNIKIDKHSLITFLKKIV